MLLFSTLNATFAHAAEPVTPTSTTEEHSARAGAFRFASKPRWEFGVGGGYLDGFDYPASNDPNQRGIALPFFIYRSPVWRVGDGGVGAVAIECPRVKLDLSLAASLSASSEGNSAREGMPNLDYLLELGPQLEVRLLQRDWGAFGRSALNWRAKLRGVIATDFGSVDALGTVFATGLNFRQKSLAGRPVDLIVNLDVTFASVGVQEYFYAVDPEFATDQRAVYEARGGYLQTRALVALAVRPTARIRLFAGVSTGLFNGAANAASPLHETDRSSGFALGFVWTILQSEARIPVLDSE